MWRGQLCFSLVVWVPAYLIDKRSSFRGMSMASAVINETAAALASPSILIGRAQRLAWTRFFTALASGMTVSIVMLGGSMARGQGCTINASYADRCPYAARLVSKLRTAYPQATILYENRAVGGMTTGWALLSLPVLSRPVTTESNERVDASLLLLDYGTNDAFEAQGHWSAARKRAEPDTYMRLKKALKRYGMESEQVFQSVTAATEAMLRYLLAHTAGAAPGA